MVDSERLVFVTPRTVENSNKLGGIPAEDYLPERFDAFNVLSNAPKSYTASRPCIVRPSFRGRTVQDGTPSPEAPAPIKGVLNPWARAYTGEPVQVTADVEPMMALPDGTSDQIVLRDGVWGIERPVIKIILNGNSNWQYFSENNYTIDNYFVEFPEIVPNQGEVIYCDTLMPVRNNINAPNYSVHVGSGYHHASIGVHLPEGAVPRNDIQAMKAWANAHPITVYCRAATPTFEPIPAWKDYGKIDPIAVTTTITKPNPDAPSSPDNIATITGTPVITTGYRGQVRQLMGEANTLPDGTIDNFNGVNLSKNTIELVFDGSESWSAVGNNFYGNFRWDLEEKNDAEFYCSRYTRVVGLDDLNAHDTAAYITIPSAADKSTAIVIKDTKVKDLSEFLAQLRSWKSVGKPLRFICKAMNRVTTRHDLNLNLLPDTNYIIECGDDNGLLDSMDITVLPDPATYGNRIYPYQHTKVGNVHQLTGTPGAAEISFEATATYGDGDTWTINGAPVAATYADGQALLPTAVLAGESVRAVLEREAVKHIDGVIMPGENLLVNSDFRKQVNTADHWNTVPTATLIPYSGYVILSDTNTGNDPSMTQPVDQLPLKKGETFTMAILCERTSDSPHGATANVWTGQSWGWINWGNASLDTYYPEIGRMQTFTATCVLDHDVGPGAYFSIGCRGTTMKIYAVKVQLGNRFAGWNTPLFDALRLLMDKPTPQPNLIVNGLLDTNHLVNQRGQNSYISESATSYGPDMWRLVGVNADIQSDGLRVYRPDIGGYGWLDQPTELLKTYRGKTVTLAVMMGGKTFTMTVQIPTDPPAHIDCGVIYLPSGEHWTIEVEGETGRLCPKLYVYAGKSYKIQAVKLEPGPRFTGWNEPKLGAELAECQRYFEMIDTGPAVNAFIPALMHGGSPQNCNFRLTFKVRKRVAPVLAINTNTGRFVTPTEIFAITKLEVANSTVDGVGIMATLDHAATTPTAGWVDCMGVFGFSADL